MSDFSGKPSPSVKFAPPTAPQVLPNTENEINNIVINNDTDMSVTKRNGDIEPVSFDKILNRIRTIGMEHSIKINYTSLVMKVIDQLYNKISTTKIDELSAEQCASMASIHPDYSILAGHIIISNHQKNTISLFSEVMTKLYNFKDIHGNHSPLVSKDLMDIVNLHSKELDNMCVFSRDYLLDFFGFKTLERAYLLKINNKSVERIQHMWLRVAIGIHGKDLTRVRETYNLMSQKYFTHATPTLFNSGTPTPQLSSCFLEALESDSIEGIYNTLKDCALISKWAGGIGIHIHNLRATGSHIRGTNGSSNGITPMLKVFNNTAKYVDQCVDPETIIYTDKGPKPIQHVVEGETQIIGLNGEYETIQKVLEHPYSGDILEISTLHSIVPLKITPEHPVYVLRTQSPGSDILPHLEKNICQMEWVDAKELEVDDWMVYSIPQDMPVTHHSLTQDDCYFFGIVLGGGYMENGMNAVGLSSLKPFHTVKQKHILDFLIRYCNERCIAYNILVEEETTCIRWKRDIHIRFRYQDFYDENQEKRIASKWLNLPIELSQYIVKGLIETGGCIEKDDLLLGHTSGSLIESVRFLCLKMGVLIHGKRNRDLGITYHCLKIPKTKEICQLFQVEYDPTIEHTFFRYKQFLFSKICGIGKTSYTGVLYDLQLKKQHDYLLHNGLVHNGGGKRSGSIAIYLEPWHADVELFLQMRKNHGDEELKARDLFYAIWMPDLFMHRVKSGGTWTLFCPDECPGLADVYGEEFVKLYESYETNHKGRKTVNARDLWFQILDAQMETGTPYIVYKDAVNQKSNQKNVGVIKSSNLCSEIVEYSDDKETAVCNLASIGLPSFVEKQNDVAFFNYKKLEEVTRTVTFNLNKVIDVNFYPIEKTRRSNMRHRPIGIGVQGLADVFMMLDLPFGSPEAREINRHIFETIYYGALSESCELAISQGPYETFDGCPASQGILQFDMWNIDPTCNRYNWVGLKQKIKLYGLRNSLLVAPMPTASTSQILGFNECFEPITSNIYSRRTLAGEFIMANKYLMNDLIKLDLWNEKLKNNIIANNGSIQQIDSIPAEIREKYKTVWELPMKTIIDYAADRGAFICQSQSLNLWLEDPNYNTLTSMHFYGWSKGLKTGIYYLRRRGVHKAQQFTIEVEKKENNNHVMEEEYACENCSA